MSALTPESLGEVVEVRDASASGPLLVICEHASARIPAVFGELGLEGPVRGSHVAWDPGAEQVAGLMAKTFHSPIVAARVSRLIYDLNRPPDHPGAMPEKSEIFDIPGNRDLSDQDRIARISLIYDRFHDEVSRLLDRRQSLGLPTVIVTIHSFTPIYFGEPRQVEIGILHDTDDQVADLMLGAAASIAPRIVERNAPYGPEDGVTHTLKLHGIARDLPNVMIELRSDLVNSEKDCEKINRELVAMLAPALSALGLPQAERVPHV